MQVCNNRSTAVGPVWLTNTMLLNITWNFGDGYTTTLSTSSEAQHAYHVTGPRTVTVRSFNACTSPNRLMSHTLTVDPRRGYLPLMLKNK